jgi:hypothetical protein
LRFGEKLAGSVKKVVAVVIVDEDLSPFYPSG